MIGKRLTFEAAFAYSNRNLPGELCVLANADIYFDHTLTAVRNAKSLNGKVYALLRWDVTTSASLRFCPRIDQQDAWIYTPPLPSMECDFPLGLLRSDNRIAQVLEDEGLELANPALVVTARHLQLSQRRGYTEQDTVPGRTRYIRIAAAL